MIADGFGHRIAFRYENKTPKTVFHLKKDSLRGAFQSKHTVPPEYFTHGRALHAHKALFTYKHTKGRYPAEVLQGNLQLLRKSGLFPSLLPPLGGRIPFGKYWYGFGLITSCSGCSPSGGS